MLIRYISTSNENIGSSCDEHSYSMTLTLENIKSIRWRVTIFKTSVCVKLNNMTTVDGDTKIK